MVDESPIHVAVNCLRSRINVLYMFHISVTFKVSITRTQEATAMRFGRVLKFRIPATLEARLDDAASRSARTRSDLAREGLVIGLESLVRRVSGGDDLPPEAA